jgi:peptide chain release factor 2
MTDETKQSIDEKIAALETEMNSPTFWSDKNRAQAVIKELGELKAEKEGGSKYDKGSAILNILSGAGGDDAEDFSSILLNMYRKYATNKGWSFSIIHVHPNDHGGYRNISVEIDGKNVYGTLRNESGVHRLVRISPFNAKEQRHTSFSLVEVIPKFEKEGELEIPPEELDISFARAGGPGGQNVNKRETAVRIVHIPTKISVHMTSERSQAQNKEKGLQLIKGKLYVKREEERKKKEKGMSISETTDIEWGNQIRSYVFHPYKMIKDHRTNVEVRTIEKVLEGHLDEFIEAEKSL